MWSGGVTGLFFFEDEAGYTVTSNGSFCCEILTSQIWPIIDNVDISGMWFQQDHMVLHVTANKTINLLQTKLPERIISRNTAVKLPAISCDLTSLVYFCGACYVKDRVFEPMESIVDKNSNFVMRLTK